MINKRTMITGIAVTVATLTQLAPAANERETVESTYPEMASGALTYAKIGELPENTLLQTQNIEISSNDLDEEISRMRSGIKVEMKDFPFFALEQKAAEQILNRLAGKESDSADGEQEAADVDINVYLNNTVPEPEVTKEEVTAYYQKNKESIGVPLDQIRDRVRQQLKREKRQRAINELISNLGKKIDIVVSRDWIEEQAKIAKQNPIDRARSEAKPALIAFSSKGCCGPDRTHPLLDKLEGKYEDSLQVKYLDARNHQVLGARYGINSIPTFLPYDKDGSEVFRHSGSLSLDDLAEEIEETEIN